MSRAGSCEASGNEVHYLRTGGDKPAVVLLHGLMGSGACWTPVARLLEHEFDVIMPDARGHGESTGPPHGYAYGDHARDVEGLLRTLALHRPVLVGHSMGGMTAAVVASRREVDLRGLILVDPTFLTAERQREVRDSDVADQHRAALGVEKAQLVQQASERHPRRAIEIVELQAEARLNTCPAAFEVLSAPAPDYRAVVSAIDVPTLLVIGDSSPVVSPEMAADLRRLDPGMRVEQVPDAGHGLPFDQPERLASVVLSFLRTLQQRPPRA